MQGAGEMKRKYKSPTPHPQWIFQCLRGVNDGD